MDTPGVGPACRSGSGLISRTTPVCKFAYNPAPGGVACRSCSWHYAACRNRRDCSPRVYERRPPSSALEACRGPE